MLSVLIDGLIDLVVTSWTRIRGSSLKGDR
jgi:hypothetical protein